jgi:outer membrane protein assembly factor BamB
VWNVSLLLLPRHRRLSLYWNTRVLDRPPDELAPLAEGVDSTLIEALDRMTALDDARLPDDAFVNRLERDLMRVIALDQRPLGLLPPTAPMSGNGRFGLPIARPIRPGLPARARRWAGAQLTTAVMLILVLLGSFYVLYDHRPAAVPTVQGTPSPAATPEATPDAHAWPVTQGGNAARTRNMPGPAPAGEPLLLWKYPPAGASGIGSISGLGPVSDGVLYVAGGSAFAALDAATGRELWRTSEVSGAGAIAGEGIILRTAVPTGGGYDLVRISRVDGSIVWRAEQGQIGENWTPAVANGVGYTPSGGDFIAFDLATGAALWRVPLEAPAIRGAAVAEGLAAIADQNGKVYGIDTSGGNIVWTYQTDAGTIGTPSLANGTVYFTAYDGPTLAFYALDAATGVLKWRFLAPNGENFNNAAIGETTVYVTNEDAALYALDAATGTPRWTFQTDADASNHPVLVGDAVFLTGHDGFVHALDATTGVERWRFTIEGQSDTSPVIVDGVYYVGTGAGELLAIGGSESAAVTGLTPQAEASPTATVAADSGGTAAAEFLWQTTGGAQPFGKYTSGITVAPDDRLWVADGALNQFQIFEPDGTFVEAWGTPGSGDGQFNFLRANSDGDTFGAVAFAPDGSFFVADEGNFRIQKFDRDRNFLFAWGSAGTGDGQFLSPEDVEVDAAGNVFVDDDKRNDVQKFAPDGTFLLKFGGFGSGEGQLNFQGWMTIDGDGNVWVADPLNGRVQVWDNDGRFLASWDGNGRLGALAVAVDERGRVYVADGDRHGVVVLDRFGNEIAFWGGEGAGEGQFTTPTGIVLDGQGNVYVVDIFGPTTRVQKFRLLPPLGPA